MQADGEGSGCGEAAEGKEAQRSAAARLACSLQKQAFEVWQQQKEGEEEQAKAQPCVPVRQHPRAIQARAFLSINSAHKGLAGALLVAHMKERKDEYMPAQLK